MALVAVDTLFFSLALGMCVSSLSRSGRKATVVTLLLILLFVGLLPLISGLFALYGKAPNLQAGLLLPSAGFAYASAFDVNYKANANPFWWSLAVIHVLSWVSLAIASAIVPRTWQDKPGGARKRRWRELWRLWSYGQPAERLAFRQRMLDRNAFYWLAARDRLRPVYVWAALGLVGLAWVWGLAKVRRDWLNTAVYLVTALVLNALLKGWAAMEAGRQLAEERHQGTLELVLSTPLTVRDILRGQALAMKRHFLGPVLAVLAVWMLFLLGTLYDSSTDAQDHIAWSWFWLAGMGMLAADIDALYWVGLWQGLTAKNPHRAMSRTVARVLVLPWLGLAAVALVMALLETTGASNTVSPSWGASHVVLLWVVLGLATDLWFALSARQKLLNQFRLMATERFARRRGFWARLFGGRKPEDGNDLSPHS
jgi:hypothetical protein